MGFIPDITKIASLLPPMRQTLLFSATMPPEISKLSEKFLSNPKEIRVNPPAETATTVKQFMVKTSPRQKRETLLKIIEQENVGNAFIFCNRKRDIDGLTSWLKNKGYQVAAMHGDMDQSQRTATLKRFKDDEIRLLICSDVAARGIDVQGLSHVFNFDVPMSADDYVHRVGRTGRAGKEGRAWMLATDSEDKYVKAIENLIKRDIEVVDINGGKSPKAQNADKSSAPKREKAQESKPSERKKAAPQKNDSKSQDKPNPAYKSDTADKKKQSDNPYHNKSANRPNHTNKNDDDSGTTGFGDEMPAFFSK